MEATKGNAPRGQTPTFRTRSALALRPFLPEVFAKLYQDISEPNCRRVVRVSVETVDLVAQIDGGGGASRPGGPPEPPTAAESQAPYTYPDFRYPVPMAAEP